MTEQTDEQTQIAVEKLLGKKKFDVSASELVYYSKIVWAHDEEDAIRIALDEGFVNEDIFDGADFEINGAEEVVDDTK